jgi:hypothetical protein
MSSSEPPTPAATPTNEDEAKRRDEDHKSKVGIANFEDAKRRAGGLSAFEKTEEGKKWLASLVPKESTEGKDLKDKLTQYLENTKLFDDDDVFQEFQDLLNSTKEFYNERIKIYTHVLTHPDHGEEATKQICTLAGILDATFKQGYKNIFQTWIQIGDEDALDEWSKWQMMKGAK